jgi:hypothetical protein
MTQKKPTQKAPNSQITTRRSARLANAEATAAATAGPHPLRPRNRKQQQSQVVSAELNKPGKNTRKNMARKLRLKAKKEADERVQEPESPLPTDSAESPVDSAKLVESPSPQLIEPISVAEKLKNKNIAPCRKTGSRAPRLPAPAPLRSSPRLAAAATAAAQPATSVYSLRSYG